jgi:hypothetical protein
MRCSGKSRRVMANHLVFPEARMAVSSPDSTRRSARCAVWAKSCQFAHSFMFFGRLAQEATCQIYG